MLHLFVYIFVVEQIGNTQLSFVADLDLTDGIIAKEDRSIIKEALKLAI